MTGRIENLRPWKPGQSGNPGGRPKKKLIDEALEELLARNDSQLAITIAKKLLERAEQGELRAIQLIAERVQGRPRAKMELNISDSGSGSRFSHMKTEELDAEIERICGEFGYVKKDDGSKASVVGTD